MVFWRLLTSLFRICPPRARQPGSFIAGLIKENSSFTSLFSTLCKDQPAETVALINSLSNIDTLFFDIGRITKESSEPLVEIDEFDEETMENFLI